MRRWMSLRLTSVAVVGLLVGALSPVATVSASTHARLATIRTGTTSVTTGPGIAAAMLSVGIVPFVTSPGSSTLVAPTTAPALVATYPVTSGTASLRPLSAVIGHRGGLLLVNVSNGRRVLVDSFVVNVRQRVLTVRNAATGVRLAAFSLNLTRARVASRGKVVSISRIGLVLTQAGASALNTDLGTTAFAGGLPFGTAATRLVLR